MILKDKAGECLTLSHFGENLCVNRKNQKCMPIPSCIHVFIFPHVLESGGTFFYHPSFMFSNFFSSLCMPNSSSGSHQKVVVHSDHSLFHSVPARCTFVLLAEPCFVLGCSHVVTTLSHVKVRGFLCLLNE